MDGFSGSSSQLGKLQDLRVSDVVSVPDLRLSSKKSNGHEKELPNLDFLRVWAVMLVLLSHLLFLLQLQDTPGSLKYRSLGAWGVLMFFVHTSLVLTMSLDRNYRSAPSARLFAPFMIRRIFRVFPLSMFTVAMVWLFSIPLGHIVNGKMVPVTLDNIGWLSNLLLLQNLTHYDSPNVPLWSLPYEMQMYFFLPALFLLARYAWGLGPLLAMWALALFSMYHEPALARHHLPDFVEYVAYFIPGVIAYKVTTLVKPRLPAWLWPTFVVSLTAYYLLAPTMTRGAVCCLLLGALIPLFEEIPSYKLVEVIARYSYGIYLTQYFCIWLGFEAGPNLPWPAKWALFLLLIMLIPIGLYHLVEKPMIELGRKVATWSLIARGERAEPTSFEEDLAASRRG
jgi:peptidoglycan/LPS O-acetylase OafA/YrhL